MLAHSRFFAAALLLMSVCSVAYAQDIYIKPSSTAPHPVDLGLGVKQAPPAVVQQPAPQPVQQPTPQPQQPAPQPVVLQPTPQPTPVQYTGGGNAEVITVADAPIKIEPGSGPNIVSISVLPAAIGQNEVNEANKTLGLNQQEILTNCMFENMFVLSIGASGTAIAMGQLASAQQRFNGNISSVDVYPTLACKKIRRPVSGMVIEQGAYYKISVQNVTCPPPPHGGSLNISYKYLGNGRGDCLYK
jgi:hypothetical protein